MLTEGQENFLNKLDPKKLNRIVNVEPWDPRGLVVAEDIVGEIKQIVPELEVQLTGSMYFKIAGERDLDISVYCPKAEQTKYVDRFVKLFENVKSEGRSHVGWEFEREGFHVTVVLTDLASPTTKAQRDLFELLKSKPELVKEYEQIKLAASGKTYKEYQLAKYEFYNRVLGIA